MKIYIASHDQELAQQAADYLELMGHELVARWVWYPFNPTETHTIQERKDIAQMDADDVADCDCLILLSGPAKYSGGKFVEAGIALALGKRVVVVGVRENMLLWHPKVEQIDDVREFA
jgi:nucleoside 2-deoxyribosyltransferase